MTSMVGHGTMTPHARLIPFVMYEVCHVTLLTALFTTLLNQLSVGGGAGTSASADSCEIGSTGIESCLCSVK